MHVKVSDKNPNWATNSSKSAINMEGAIETKSTEQYSREGLRSMIYSLTKTTTFGLNDLLKHEPQQASVTEEGEAAVSLEG